MTKAEIAWNKWWTSPVEDNEKYMIETWAGIARAAFFAGFNEGKKDGSQFILVEKEL